jgi:hypothetical protein
MRGAYLAAGVLFIALAIASVFAFNSLLLSMFALRRAPGF